MNMHIIIHMCAHSRTSDTLNQVVPWNAIRSQSLHIEAPGLNLEDTLWKIHGELGIPSKCAANGHFNAYVYIYIYIYIYK